MPRQLSLLAAAATTLPAAAFAACVQPAEKTAFDVRALQSQLMVVALVCQQHDDYNAFVRRHMNDLGAANQSLMNYHRRAHGAQHQRQLDLYITNLANSQMQAGIAQGSHFCRNQAPLFQLAMAATNRAELANIAVTQRVPQPLELTLCPAAPQRATQRTAAASRPQAGQAQTR